MSAYCPELAGLSGRFTETMASETGLSWLPWTGDTASVVATGIDVAGSTGGGDCGSARCFGACDLASAGTSVKQLEQLNVMGDPHGG